MKFNHSAPPSQKKVQLFRNNFFQFFTPPLHPAPFAPSHKCLKTGLFLDGHEQQRQDSSSRIEVLPSTEEGAGAGRASQPVPASPDSSTSNLDPPPPYYMDPHSPPLPHPHQPPLLLVLLHCQHLISRAASW